jgi:hypothetical protein
MNRLLQFGSTLEGLCVSESRRQATEALATAQTLQDVASGLRILMPPVESLRLRSEGEVFESRLQFEDGYCAGYEELEDSGPGNALTVDRARQVTTLNVCGRRIDVFVTPLSDYPGFDPEMAMLRLSSCLSLARPIVGCNSSIPEKSTTTISQLQRTLSREEVLSLRIALEQQPMSGRGAQAACRGLYVIETIMRNYEKGEAVISNDGSRKFMQGKIGQKASGYQVASKALRRLLQETEKLIPGALRFSPLTSSTVKVSWKTG